jgi:hypothetical protein
MPRYTCTKCGKRKNPQSFRKHKRQKNELDSRCKKCVDKESKIRNELHKVAPEKPEVCPICIKLPENFNAPFKWHLDHDPIEKYFRGWLCERCNLAIGSLGDTIEALTRALNYLLEAKIRQMKIEQQNISKKKPKSKLKNKKKHQQLLINYDEQLS